MSEEVGKQAPPVWYQARLIALQNKLREISEIIDETDKVVTSDLQELVEDYNTLWDNSQMTARTETSARIEEPGE